MDVPEDIYSTRILEIVASMPEFGLLDGSDADGSKAADGSDTSVGSATKSSKLCGSRVQVDVRLDDSGLISAYGHKVEACLLGQASCAVMARNAVGLSFKDVLAVRDQMTAMLKEGADAPDGIWSDLEVLYPVKDYKPRHTSMMLVFEAVIEAMQLAAFARGIELVSV